MKFGLPISIMFHALAVLGGLFVWSGKIAPLANERIIPLELVRVSDMTDIAPTRTDDESKHTEAGENAKADSPEPSDAPVLPPEPETNTPEPAPVFDLDELEKAFADVRQTDPQAGTQQVLANEAQNLERAQIAKRAEGAGADSKVAAIDYIRARLKECWYIDTGAPYYEQLYVIVMVHLKADASIANIEVVNQAEILASGNRYWKIAQENALSGLYACAPYIGLKTVDYDIWKQLLLHLYPGENE